MPPTALTGADRAALAEHGFLVCPDFLDAAALARVHAWVDEVAAWPPGGGAWLQHREQTGDGPRLCRSENFVPFHDGLRALVTSGALPAMAGVLLGEDAVLYKEKINYKFPGGAGYAPHQDATAYKFVRHHVTCMIAVDDFAAETGWLEFAQPVIDLLPTDGDGCIRADVAAELTWSPVPTAAGSLLWFHSRAPHRSAPNRGTAPRRGIFLTYNAASEGDLRAAYYADKVQQLAAHGTRGATRVSTIGHFQGRPVEGTP